MSGSLNQFFVMKENKLVQMMVSCGMIRISSLIIMVIVVLKNLYRHRHCNMRSLNFMRNKCQFGKSAILSTGNV